MVKIVGQLCKNSPARTKSVNETGCITSLVDIYCVGHLGLKSNEETRRIHPTYGPGQGQQQQRPPISRWILKDIAKVIVELIEEQECVGERVRALLSAMLGVEPEHVSSFILDRYIILVPRDPELYPTIPVYFNAEEISPSELKRHISEAAKLPIDQICLFRHPAAEKERRGQSFDAPIKDSVPLYSSWLGDRNLYYSMPWTDQSIIIECSIDGLITIEHCNYTDTFSTLVKRLSQILSGIHGDKASGRPSTSVEHLSLGFSRSNWTPGTEWKPIKTEEFEELPIGQQGLVPDDEQPQLFVFQLQNVGLKLQPHLTDEEARGIDQSALQSLYREFSFPPDTILVDAEAWLLDRLHEQGFFLEKMTLFINTSFGAAVVDRSKSLRELHVAEFQEGTYFFPNDKTICLRVNTLQEKLHCVWVPLDLTVLDLKDRMEDITNLSGVKFRLIFQGRDLQDDQVLANTGLTNSSLIFLAILLRGD